jgi:hypothetical protein
MMAVRAEIVRLAGRGEVVAMARDPGEAIAEGMQQREHPFFRNPDGGPVTTT